MPDSAKERGEGRFPSLQQPAYTGHSHDKSILWKSHNQCHSLVGKSNGHSRRKRFRFGNTYRYGVFVRGQRLQQASHHRQWKDWMYQSILWIWKPIKIHSYKS